MNEATIVFITSNNIFLNLITEFLREKSVAVVSAQSDSDFLSIVETHEPDIIIVDTKTQNLQPEFICRDLRKRFPHIPQIIITESKDTAHITKFLKIPVQDFLIKPINPQVLYLRIKNNLTRVISDVKKYKNGDILVDEQKKRVVLKHKPVNLSPKEYRLLRYLMANKGRVLSRESILDNVWGHDTYVLDRNVDVYIGYLRKKLSSHKTTKYIKTIPTFGYMMVSLKKK